MSKPKITYTATASDGTVIEFVSTRVSTHAVMVKSERQSDGDTRWGLISTNGRYELALKELLKWKQFIARTPENWNQHYWDGKWGTVQRHVAYELVELGVKA